MKEYTTCLDILGKFSDEKKKEEKESVILTNRGFAHLKAKKFEECEKDCTKALAINPTNRKALKRL